LVRLEVATCLVNDAVVSKLAENSYKTLEAIRLDSCQMVTDEGVSVLARRYNIGDSITRDRIGDYIRRFYHNNVTA
jgi:hypothetical protein